MTISTSANQVTIGGNGATTIFNFSFPGVSSDVIEVLYADISGNITTLDPTAYTLSLNAPSGGIWGLGGSVTYNPSGTPIPTGSSLTIMRVLPEMQGTSISNQGASYPQVIETALDYLTMVDQQISEEQSRALTFPVGSASNAALPGVSQRANTLLGFDANGNVQMMTPAGVQSPAITYEIDGNTSHVYSSADWGADINRAGTQDMTDSIAILPGGWWTYILNRTTAYSIYITASAGRFFKDNTVSVNPLVIAPGQRVKIMSVGNGNYNILHINQTPRIRLVGNITLYVAADGNDSNSGLTAARAFLTIQKAVDTLMNNYDLNGYTATISVGAGTYTGTVAVNGPFTGQGAVQLQGDNTTPSNVVISTTSADCISVNNGALVFIQGFKLTAATSGRALTVSGKGSIASINGNMNYGTVNSGYEQLTATNGGSINLKASYTISGGGAAHIAGYTQGAISYVNSPTVTLLGTPAFTYFAVVNNASVIDAPSITFSGSATGARYSATLNGAIDAYGNGATYFPGNSGGSTATGGQYA